MSNRRNKMQGSKMPQSKNWCFTFFPKGEQTIEWFSDTITEKTCIEKTNIVSVAMGEEVCPKTQRQHLQGFLQTRKKSMTNEVRKHRCQYSIT